SQLDPSDCTLPYSTLTLSLHLISSIHLLFFLLRPPHPPPSTLFPYTTLFRSDPNQRLAPRPPVRGARDLLLYRGARPRPHGPHADRKSTRLNSSHQIISYAVFCLKKKKKRVEKEYVNYKI